MCVWLKIKFGMFCDSAFVLHVFDLSCRRWCTAQRYGSQRQVSLPTHSFKVSLNILHKPGTDKTRNLEFLTLMSTFQSSKLPEPSLSQACDKEGGQSLASATKTGRHSSSMGMALGNAWPIPLGWRHGQRVQFPNPTPIWMRPLPWKWGGYWQCADSAWLFAPSPSPNFQVKATNILSESALLLNMLWNFEVWKVFLWGTFLCPVEILPKMIDVNPLLDLPRASENTKNQFYFLLPVIKKGFEHRNGLHGWWWRRVAYLPPHSEVPGHMAQCWQCSTAQRPPSQQPGRSEIGISGFQDW